jgi:hypothetical protein
LTVRGGTDRQGETPGTCTPRSRPRVLGPVTEDLIRDSP